jgi:type II secretion system protein G
MKSWAKQTGFTIVELLIVIVVIGILAAITIVAYNGIQQRGRDSDRKSGISTIQKALELYHADNGGYPTCVANVTYIAGGARGSCITDGAGFIGSLAPKYIQKVPQDPTGTGDFRYFYVYGSKKMSDTTYSASSDDNYIIGVHFESQGGPYVGSWSPQNYNFIAGSSN